MELRVGGGIIALRIGDITTLPADAIVNAANSRLAGGGGVDGAIHRAGGPAILADLERRYGPGRHCPVGRAVVSEAGALPARWVIHAVGPRWAGGTAGEPELLASAYVDALRHATEVEAAHVTAPAISCGIYGYPVDAAAAVAVRTVAHEVGAASGRIERVTFVLRPDTIRPFEAALAGLAP